MRNRFKLITLLAFLVMASCKSAKNEIIDNSLLIGNGKKPSFSDIYNELNKYEVKDSSFILYSLFYYTIAYPKDKLPQKVTQYLFIPKEKRNNKLNSNEHYFEIYKYTNYQNKIRLNDAIYKEYDNIIKLINSILLNNDIECNGYSSSFPILGYNLYFNMFNKESYVNSINNNLLSNNNSYSNYCFSSYLRTVLFEKEYNLDNYE